jgi:hypothetical protein
MLPTYRDDKLVIIATSQFESAMKTVFIVALSYDRVVITMLQHSNIKKTRPVGVRQTSGIALRIRLPHAGQENPRIPARPTIVAP